MSSIQAISFLALPQDLLCMVVNEVLDDQDCHAAALNCARLARVCKLLKSITDTRIRTTNRAFCPVPSTKISFVCGLLTSGLSQRFTHLDFASIRPLKEVLNALSLSPARAKLQSLALSGTSLRDIQLTGFLQSTSLPQLQTLEISNADLSSQFLSQIPRQCPALTSLTLRRCTGLDDAALSTIVSELALKELVIAPAEIQSANFLQEMGRSPIRKSLERFVLEKCLKCNLAFQELSKAHVSFDKIKQLSLQGSPTEPETYRLIEVLFPHRAPHPGRRK